MVGGDRPRFLCLFCTPALLNSSRLPQNLDNRQTVITQYTGDNALLFNRTSCNRSDVLPQRIVILVNMACKWAEQATSN